VTGQTPIWPSEISLGLFQFRDQILLELLLQIPWKLSTASSDVENVDCAMSFRGNQRNIDVAAVRRDN
jgi:hypothetical protein